MTKSIRKVGRLQPIGVTDNFRLVFGERRLRAQRDILKKKTSEKISRRQNELPLLKPSRNRSATGKDNELTKHFGKKFPKLLPANEPVRSLLRRPVSATIRLTAKPPR